MSDNTPFKVEREEFLSNLMTMRETASMLIAFKKTHPKTFPGDNELWAKDLNELEIVISQYDSLIFKLLEVNLQQSDFIDQIIERLNKALPPKDA